jgi:hypothetical protein
VVGVQGNPCLKKAGSFNPHDKGKSDKSYVQTGNRFFLEKKHISIGKVFVVELDAN